MVEAPVESALPSCAARAVALTRVSARVSRLSERLLPRLVLFSLTSESVSRAEATVPRALAMEACAPSMPSARSPSFTEASARSLAAASRAPSSPSAAPPTKSPSFSVTVLPTTLTNSLEIWFSRVVEPVSVTLGAMALAFSFT